MDEAILKFKKDGITILELWVKDHSNNTSHFFGVWPFGDTGVDCRLVT
jgi:hypothetical protein